LESPATQLARCSLVAELKAESELDFCEMPRLFSGTSSSGRLSRLGGPSGRSSEMLSPMASKKRLCIEPEFHLETAMLIPSSPSIPIKSYKSVLSDY
jgi:hypothetical protein